MSDSLKYFKLTGQYKAIVSNTTGHNDDDYDEDDIEPEVTGISAVVTFTPSRREFVSEVDKTTYRLQPVKARLEDDGKLKLFDGTEGIKLVTNYGALDHMDKLCYKVEFSKVVYDKQHDMKLESFEFEAPPHDKELDLSEVKRINYKKR